MSNKKKDNIDLTDFDVMPDVLDGKHQVIPIITGGDEVTENVAIPESLPILSLRSSVLFPGAITPITVGREKSIKLVRDVNAEGGLLGAVLQRESEVEIPAPDDMYKVGTAARIIKILEMPNGNLTVILSGLEKIEVGEYLQSEPYLRATVRTIRDSQPDAGNVEFQALVDSVREVSLNIINISPSMPKEAAFAIKNIDSQRGLINFICSNMDFSDEDRQALLEAPGLLARARKLLEILVREQQLAELKGEIQEKVKREIDKQQRDYYLQQQMRTIQDELGDSTDAEIEQMREAAAKKNWPKEVGELFEKELSKVERLNPAVAEKGLMVLDCTAHGRAGHAARNEGVNAIYEALPDMEWFRTHRFERVSPLLGPVKMTVTGVQAGTQHNVVPAECRFMVDVRVNELYTNGELLAEIRSSVGCDVVPRSTHLCSSSIDVSHPAVRRLVASGRKPFGSPTMSNQAVMPFRTVKVGPGDSARSHTADEYICLDEIREATGIYTSMLDGLVLSE